MIELPSYFDPHQPIANLSGNLPHWRQDGVVYFVTFRLADSLPQSKLRQLRAEREAWLRVHSEPWNSAERSEYYTQFVDRVQRWLDAGYGACILQQREVREIVEKTLRHFDGERYELGEHTIMPNHVHALVSPLGEHELSEILHSWKSFSAHEIKKRLPHRGVVWQKESFDHIIRNPRQLGWVEEYIRDNPGQRA